MKKRFSDEQIIGFLAETDSGVAVKELCRRHANQNTNYCGSAKADSIGFTIFPSDTTLTSP